MKKRFITNLTAVILATLIALSVCTVAFADTADEDAYYSGAFYYRPAAGEYSDTGDRVDCYTFSDAYFKASAKVYNPSLAAASMALAVTSVSSGRSGYAGISRNIKAFLEDVGFSDVEVNEDFRTKAKKDSIAVACAHKRITQDGRDYTLLVIAPRSAGYGAEWGNNFILGKSGDAKGFDESADRALAYARQYAAAHAVTGDLKVWAVGYSRAAAVVNLIGKKLIDDANAYLGDTVTLRPEDLYAYTFGTPSPADTNNHPRDARYAGIFNSFSDTEIAAAMAPAAMGFERYGTDLLLPSDDRYDRMLENLRIISEDVYAAYTTESNSKFFRPKKLLIDGGSASLIDDDSSYITPDAAGYLKDLCAYLTQVCGGRENYAAVYEQPLSDLLAYTMSLSGSGLNAFLEAFQNDENTLNLLAAMYAYFMRLKQQTKTAPTGAQAVQKARELAAIAASADLAPTDVDAADLIKLAATLFNYMLKSPTQLMTIASDYLGGILQKAMTASGATQEELKRINTPANQKALVHFASHMILGNIRQSDKVEAYNFDNEQIKNAATLIGNYQNLFFDHYNEIVISWLKVDDPHYADVEPMTPAQLAGYRRLALRSDAPVSGTVTDGKGTVAGIIRNGVLTDTTDKWLGFTPTDDGGFFRLPSDQSYTVTLTVPDRTTLSVDVSEYRLSDAECFSVIGDTITTDRGSIVTIALPALKNAASLPSADTAYSLSVKADGVEGILGDADTDGEVRILDATAVQRHIAELETLSEIGALLSDVDRDNNVTVIDATYIQRYLVHLPAADGIGDAY